MLLKVLMRKVKEWVEANPVDTGSLIIKMEASQREMDLDGFIAKLDARQLGVLRTLVPEAFPKNLREGEIEAKVNIHGAWQVDVK